MTEERVTDQQQEGKVPHTADEWRATAGLRLEILHRDVGEVKLALRDLTAAITRLALIEERQGQVAASLDRAFAALERMDQRIATLEKMAPMNNQSSEWVYRALWAAAAVAATLLAKMLGIFGER